MALAVALAVAATAAAAQPEDMAVYAGGLLGRTRFSESCSPSCDEASRAVRVFAGVQVTKYFGMELGAASLGETQTEELGVPVTTRVRVVDFSLLGYLPLAQKVALFGRLGAYYGKTTSTLTDSGTGATFGVGAQLAVTQNLGLRIEWQDYSTLSSGLRVFNANVLGVAALWRF